MDRRELLCAAAGAAALFAGGGVLRAWAGPSGSGSSAQLLRPPGGQDENRLLGACVRCGRCRSVCPAQCIAVAHVEDGLVNARTPKLDFTLRFVRRLRLGRSTLLATRLAALLWTRLHACSAANACQLVRMRL